MNRIKNKLFTLIELITVIVVLGILAAIVIPNISSFKEEAEETAILSDTKNIQTAVDMFILKNVGDTPTQNKPTLGNPQTIELYGMKPDYLRDVPKTINKTKFWLDQNNTVWASMVDAPSNVKYIEGNTELTWDTVDGAELYKIYKSTNNEVTSKVNSNQSLKFVDDFIPTKNIKPSIQLSKLNEDIYLVSAIDKYGFESAPTKVNGEYSFYQAPSKEIVLTNLNENKKSEPKIVWNYETTEPISDASILNSGVLALKLPQSKKLLFVNKEKDIMHSIDTNSTNRMASLNKNGDKVFFYFNGIVHVGDELGNKTQISHGHYNFPIRYNMQQTNSFSGVISTIQEVSAGKYLLSPINGHLIGEGSMTSADWYYGKYQNQFGCTANAYNSPESAFKITEDTVLIADTNNNRIIIVKRGGLNYSPLHTIEWNYGECGGNELSKPSYAEMLSNGNVLITDKNNHRIIEVNKEKEIIWQYGQTGISGKEDGLLSSPERAKKLPDGSILIIDSGNNRVLTVK